MITGNKGEWSEVYVFLKLLGEGFLYAADENLNKIEELSFPVTGIKRDKQIYQTDDAERRIKVIDGKTQEVLVSLCQSEFLEKANVLLDKIKQGSATFNVDEIEQFMNNINVLTLKSPSDSKGDINIVLYDIFTSQNREFSFSIKSQVGGSSTLLNAGRTTNFIYQVERSIDDDFIQQVNEISTTSKVKDRIYSILKNNAKLSYFDMENETFNMNLQLIDSRLPEIISNMLLYYYGGLCSSVKDATELLNRNNPLGFNIEKNRYFYEYKIKKFLREIALGMVPSKKWNGKLDATGGYIIVKKTGDVVCYHIYNMNQFEEYLFNNTKFETASSSRHRFGMIYKEGKYLLFKLNLQIRFNK